MDKAFSLYQDQTNLNFLRKYFYQIFDHFLLDPLRLFSILKDIRSLFLSSILKKSLPHDHQENVHNISFM